MIALHFYPARQDAPLAFARHPRLFVELSENGKHAHAFRGRDGVWRVTERDVMRGRVTRDEAEYLSWRLQNVGAYPVFARRVWT
jgi:hypothetical protein